MLKGISEHSTLLTGQFNMKIKHDFNNLIKHCDQLIEQFERPLNDEQKEYIANVTDVYHNINLELRKEAEKKYEELV